MHGAGTAGRHAAAAWDQLSWQASTDQRQTPCGTARSVATIRGLGLKSRDTSIATDEQQPTSLFDHLVGAGEQRGRHGKAERLGSFKVDHQLEFFRFLDREVARRRAL
jgi:hypothetical protein